MKASAVAELVGRLEVEDVRVWLDGGWGVDALLGRQTRRHADLDVVVDMRDAPLVEQALRRLGFALMEDERPTRFVLAHPDGRSLDVHPVTFDVGERPFQQLQDGRLFHYPAGSFDGRGVVGERVFACVSAEGQLLSHTGYPPQAKDVADVRRLCQRFALPLPVGY